MAIDHDLVLLIVAILAPILSAAVSLGVVQIQARTSLKVQREASEASRNAEHMRNDRIEAGVRRELRALSKELAFWVRTIREFGYIPYDTTPWEVAHDRLRASLGRDDTRVSISDEVAEKLYSALSLSEKALQTLVVLGPRWEKEPPENKDRISLRISATVTNACKSLRSLFILLDDDEEVSAFDRAEESAHDFVKSFAGFQAIDQRRSFEILRSASSPTLIENV